MKWVIPQVVNALSIRHQRPFKAVTASDDCCIVFHSGVPFKFDKVCVASLCSLIYVCRRRKSFVLFYNKLTKYLQTIKTHTKFVQDVKFSPSGDHFASVGSDAKLFLYDGKTGDTIGEFSGDLHKGSAVSFIIRHEKIVMHFLLTDVRKLESGQQDDSHLIYGWDSQAL